MKILIADDEMLIRRALERIFVSRGHIVQSVEDGVAAVKAWKEFNPDLVILDILMPGMTGIEVLKEMGPKRRAKVALISAYSGHEEVGSYTKLGIETFIQKPFNDIYAVAEQMENL